MPQYGHRTGRSAIREWSGFRSVLLHDPHVNGAPDGFALVSWTDPDAGENNSCNGIESAGMDPPAFPASSSGECAASLAMAGTA